MVNSRAEVRDMGLARHLGKEVFVRKDGSKIKGKLSYLDGFQVWEEDENLVSIVHKDVVGLPVGSVLANYDPHLREYTYYAIGMGVSA